MFKSFILTPLGVVFLFLASCQSPTEDSSHFIWKYELNGTTHYLAGINEADFSDLKPDSLLLEIFQESNPIIFEIHRDSARYQSQLLFNEEGFYDGMLEEKISAETYQKLENQLVALDWSLGHMPRMKPWLLNQSLAQLEMEKAGLSKDYMVDLLFERAKAEGKTIKSLSVEKSTNARFAQQSETAQLQLLEKRLETSDENIQNLKACAKAYQNHLPEEIKTCVQKRWDAYPSEIYQSLIIDHNKFLTDQILSHSSEDSTSLVILNLENLLGEDGVLSLLKEKGISINPL